MDDDETVSNQLDERGAARVSVSTQIFCVAGHTRIFCGLNCRNLLKGDPRGSSQPGKPLSQTFS